ncbi:MAG: type II toxin-antitoxin system prevent-host-death family antitoxin [Sulfuricellaceae bacterium]
MKTITATEAKTKFGLYLDMSRTEPVTIEKSGRDIAVMISIEEYRRFRALEDAYWLDRAKQAIAGGFVGHEESMKLIQGRLDADA